MFLRDFYDLLATDRALSNSTVLFSPEKSEKFG